MASAVALKEIQSIAQFTSMALAVALEWVQSIDCAVVRRLNFLPFVSSLNLPAALKGNPNPQP
jgi:hypothetical protein